MDEAGRTLDDLETPVEGSRGARPTPEAALELARTTFLSGDRIEMRTLAGELGIGRSTLYRWFGDRDRLIGDTVWTLLEDSIGRAEERNHAIHGAARLRAVIREVNHDVTASRPLRRLLTAEPEAALRVLTTKHGGVQPRVIRYFAQRIDDEREHESIAPGVEAHDLAYAIVRVTEGFLYADQITETPVDLDALESITAALLR